MTTEQRQSELKRRSIPLPHGYTAFNGRPIADCHVDQYNDIQRDICIWLKADRDPPEWLIDWSHRFFVMAATI